MTENLNKIYEEIVTEADEPKFKVNDSVEYKWTLEHRGSGIIKWMDKKNNGYWYAIEKNGGGMTYLPEIRLTLVEYRK